MPEPQSPFKRVRRHFDFDELKRVCEMRETDFPEAYDLTTYEVKQTEPDNWFAFKDNGSDILAVAHLDTVVDHDRRFANLMDTAAGPVVYSGALDDRLGAYTILELLPKLGLQFDILLTVGEEKGKSTAAYFDTDKEYNWMIEFDRGGTDVVMYQYDDKELRDLVRASGATPQTGIFSDISYMDDLEIKGMNWGVGYRDYHGPRSHAFLNDYWEMIGYFLKFHEVNKDVYLPHDNTPKYHSSWGGSGNAYSNYGRGSFGGTNYGLWDSEGSRHWSSDIPDPSIDELTEEEILEDLADLDLEDLDDIISDDFHKVKEFMDRGAGEVRELNAAPAAD